jgi:hypothetical protein
MYNIPRLMCFKNRDNFTMNGDYYSEKFRYIEIKMYRCDKNSSKVKCKSETEIDEFFKDTTFSLPVMNSYFDYGDFQKIPLGKNDPRLMKGIELDKEGVIKQYIDDRYFLEIDPNRRKKANIYL